MHPSRRTLFRVGALVLIAAAVTTLAWQVRVGEPARACGSAFDAVADRSGWEIWWAADLDEATTENPSGLIRTQLCADAVNRRTVVAAVLGVAAAVLAGLAWRPRPVSKRPPLHRVGIAATVAGFSLTVAGVAAIGLLVADADSTLFLYTDRLVVAVIGLIALVPAVALALGGWALRAATRPDDVVAGDEPDG